MNQPNILVNLDTPQFVSFLAACQAGCDAYRATNFPTLAKSELVVNQGSRYIRIDDIDRNPKYGQPNEREFNRQSAWAFIDRTTGDVLKPASFKAPAKGARGNIFDQWNGLARVTAYGPQYVKGPSVGIPFVKS